SATSALSANNCKVLFAGGMRRQIVACPMRRETNSIRRPQITEMPSDSGHTTSVWMETDVPQFFPLDRDLRVNVCIVGAGISGLTCAYLLARTGRSIAVI